MEARAYPKRDPTTHMRWSWNMEFRSEVHPEPIPSLHYAQVYNISLHRTRLLGSNHKLIGMLNYNI